MHAAVETWMKITDASVCPPELGCLETPVPPHEEPFLVLDPDPWGQPFRIDVEGPRAFRICSNGPDAEPDTDDDIAYPASDLD